MRKINDCFAFHKEDDYYIIGYPFLEQAYKGTKAFLLKRQIKKFPYLSEPLKILMSSGIAFFYDPIVDTIRVLPYIDVDKDTVSSYISIYYKNIPYGKEILDKVCEENNISTFIVSKNLNQALVQITDFLSDHNIELA